MLDELGLSNRSVSVFGIGCYTAFSPAMDVEVLQALHGRAPSLDTGLKRMRPDTIVFTVQGDGDMVNERSEEHTSELQSLMRITYAVFCLEKKTNKDKPR